MSSPNVRLKHHTDHLACNPPISGAIHEHSTYMSDSTLSMCHHSWDHLFSWLLTRSHTLFCVPNCTPSLDLWITATSIATKKYHPDINMRPTWIHTCIYTNIHPRSLAHPHPRDGAYPLACRHDKPLPMFLVLGLPWRSMRSPVCGIRQCCDGSAISHHVIGWCAVSASPLDFANCPQSECYPWNSGTCLTEPNGTLGPSVFAVREGIWQTVQVLGFVSWMNEWKMNTFTKDCCDQSFANLITNTRAIWKLI